MNIYKMYLQWYLVFLIPQILVICFYAFASMLNASMGYNPFYLSVIFGVFANFGNVIIYVRRNRNLEEGAQLSKVEKKQHNMAFSLLFLSYFVPFPIIHALVTGM